MKISLLQEREDFDTVFSTSLADFLAGYFGRDIPVLPVGQGHLTFRQNAQLNVIFPHRLARGKLDDLTKEFRYTPNLMKRLAQTAYCALSVRWPAEGFFSPPVFDLVDAPSEIENWVILPGNHSIRVIDTARESSLVFRKRGFDERFFLRDAEARKNTEAPLAPEVLEIDPDGRWYIEQRVGGLPLNRIASPKQAEASLGVAVGAIARLRDSTSHQASAQDYTRDLVAGVVDKLNDIRAALAELAPQIDRFVQKAADTISEAPSFEITLCLTHGDFQPANILVDGSTVWLIDWEYSRTRSAFYDPLVFATQSRFPAGLGARLIMAFKAAHTSGYVEALGFRQPGPATALLALFLLEELDLKLAEVAAPAITNKRAGLEAWLQEVTTTITPLLKGSEF